MKRKLYSDLVGRARSGEGRKYCRGKETEERLRKRWNRRGESEESDVSEECLGIREGKKRVKKWKIKAGKKSNEDDTKRKTLANGIRVKMKK